MFLTTSGLLLTNSDRFLSKFGETSIFSLIAPDGNDPSCSQLVKKDTKPPTKAMVEMAKNPVQKFIENSKAEAKALGQPVEDLMDEKGLLTDTHLAPWAR